MAEIEAPRLMFVLLMLLFFYLSPDLPQSSPAQQLEHDIRITEAKVDLDRLRNSTYGQFDPDHDNWVDLTGFRRDDGYPWHQLVDIKQAARKQLLDIQRVYGKDVSDRGDEKSYEEARLTMLPLYQNVSGTVQGKFKRDREVPVPRFNLSEVVPGNDYVTNEFIRNVTEAEGEITVCFNEDKITLWELQQPSISSIGAEVTLFTKSSPGSGWEFRLYGVHMHRSGSILLTTTSEKYGGIFALPQLALTKSDFDTSKSLLNQSITETINKWENMIEGPTLSPWTSNVFDAASPLFPTPACDFVIYLQQHPLYLSASGDDFGLLKSIEQELRSPMGVPLPSAPPMTMSATIYSPDCGFILQSRGLPDETLATNHLSGPRKEVFWRLTRNLILALLIVLGIQIALIKRQVDEASTPSTRSRISYETIGLMAMGDGLMFSALVGFLMVNDSVFLLLAAICFFCFFHIAILEMRFIFDIWTVQVGDLLQRQRERERQRILAAARQPTAVSTISVATPVQAPSAPPTVSAPATRPIDSGATPIILPPDQEVEVAAEEDERLLPIANEQATSAPATTGTAATTTATTGPTPVVAIGSDFGTIYARFYFSILSVVLLSLWAYSWPKAIRSAYVNLLTFIYLSFWIPQIYRNTMRNCRRALRWEYVIGISICRLVPIVYVYAKERNTFSFDINPTGALFFVAWVWLQVLVLISQQFLGPRLLVKDSWCPPAYDYHPILRDDADDPEAGSTLPIGFVASASEARDTDTKDKTRHEKSFDCAICMQEIEVQVVSKTDEGRGASWLGRMNYMVTPCRHIFHTGCLEGWMRLRLVCPICREGLPPI